LRISLSARRRSGREIGAFRIAAHIVSPLPRTKVGSCRDFRCANIQLCAG
jgi:hypothetical protein